MLPLNRAWRSRDRTNPRLYRRLAKITQRVAGRLLLRVGTRGSRLSLVQTDMVVEKIRRANPAVEIERKIITTSGDVDRTTPLFSISQKGIFEKEVDQAVLEGKVDFAVHSMKDVPTLLSAKLTIASVPERGATGDVLVSKGGKLLTERGEGKTVELPSTRAEAEAERELVKVLEGGCKVPVGAIASAKRDTVQLTASIFSMDGRQRLTATRSGPAYHPAMIGRDAGEELLKQGAKRIEETWRTVYR